jgi:hypothetical protein
MFPIAPMGLPATEAMDGPPAGATDDATSAALVAPSTTPVGGRS